MASSTTVVREVAQDVWIFSTYCHILSSTSLPYNTNMPSFSCLSGLSRDMDFFRWEDVPPLSNYGMEMYGCWLPHP